MQGDTGIDIELEEPVSVSLPAGEVTVGELRISVDDADGFLRAVRRFLP
jgi:hypothetical protein